MINNIILLFGGDSCERDISIITAVQLYENIDREQYHIYPIYIYEGEMYLCEEMNIDIFQDFDVSHHKKVHLENKSLVIKSRILGYNRIKIDCALLATHGGMGENGCLQGYLDILEIPYTSSGVCASSILIDKIMTKRLLLFLNIPYVEYNTINRDDEEYENIVKSISMPLIVKPASLGSSIGIKVVYNIEELNDAIATAFCYDDNVIIERALTDFREYNIAIYKKNNEYIISDIESPRVSHSMLEFDDKYLTSGKMNGGYREFPALVDDELKGKMEKYALDVYKTLDMKGVARFDYLLENDSLYLNEVNTIPGSLAYYLFEEKGISYSELVDDMIEEAIIEKENNGKLIKYYQSSVLKTAKHMSNKLRK